MTHSERCQYTLKYVDSFGLPLTPEEKKRLYYSVLSSINYFHPLPQQQPVVEQKPYQQRLPISEAAAAEIKKGFMPLEYYI